MCIADVGTLILTVQRSEFCLHCVQCIQQAIEGLILKVKYAPPFAARMVYQPTP